MIRKVVFINLIIGATVAATNLPLIFAADVRVTVRSQTMAPAMALDPERITVHPGDTVTWLNLTGRGIKLIPDWEDAPELPPYIRDGGTVQLPFHRPGSYRYSVFTATDRFEEDRVPVKVSGVVLVNPPASAP
jgi:plastocyanin